MDRTRILIDYIRTCNAGIEYAFTRLTGRGQSNLIFWQIYDDLHSRRERAIRHLYGNQT